MELLIKGDPEEFTELLKTILNTFPSGPVEVGMTNGETWLYCPPGSRSALVPDSRDQWAPSGSRSFTVASTEIQTNPEIRINGAPIPDV